MISIEANRNTEPSLETRIIASSPEHTIANGQPKDTWMAAEKLFPV